MTENTAPEEKLLKLIRGGSHQKQSKEEKPVITKEPASLPAHRYSPFSLAWKIIRIIFILSCIYLVISFISPPKEIKITAPSKIKKTPIYEKETTFTQGQPLDFYLEPAKRRQIFISAAEQQSAQQPLKQVNKDLIKDINLVGIITGDNPQAVIENKKTQKSYYLYKGGYIDEFQVEDILEGKVILKYDNQKFELYL